MTTYLTVDVGNEGVSVPLSRRERCAVVVAMLRGRNIRILKP